MPAKAHMKITICKVLAGLALASILLYAASDALIQLAARVVLGCTFWVPCL